MDLETDSKIQQTIQTEFKNKTLICIARESIPINRIYKVTDYHPCRSIEDRHVVRPHPGFRFWPTSGKFTFKIEGWS